EREVGDGCDQAAAEDDPLAADPVREGAKNEEERRAEEQRDADEEIGGDEVELQITLDEEERVELSRVPDHALAGGGTEERQQHELVVRIGEEAIAQGLLGALPLRLEPLEDRRLLQLEPDVDGDQEQRDGNEERKSPAPIPEVGGGHVDAADEDDDEREEHADRSRRLDPGRRISALD